MDFFSSTYNALRGPQGAPQSATDAIGKLSDRLSQSTLLSDRRASVLSLKGLVRDWKTEVGDVALPGLIEVLLNDCEVDADIGKGCLETIIALCEIGGEGDLHGGIGALAPAATKANAKDSGWRHMDYFLANETATHKLLFLLSDEAFYTRFCSLQLLALLLQHRRTVVQKYFISSPNGVGTSGILATLNDKKEILRNGKRLPPLTISYLTAYRGSRNASGSYESKCRNPEDSCVRRCIRLPPQYYNGRRRC